MSKNSKLKLAWKRVSHLPTCPFCTSITYWFRSFTLFYSLCLRLSRCGTICMISYFVQLIKTLGRLAPEFLVPWGDDRQLPLRRSFSPILFLILSLSPSLPLMFTSSNRQLVFARRGEWNERKCKWKKWQMCCRAISSGMWGIFFCFLEKKRTDFSFLEGLGWYVWKGAVSHLVDVLHVCDITQKETPKLCR